MPCTDVTLIDVFTATGGLGTKLYLNLYTDARCLPPSDLTQHTEFQIPPLVPKYASFMFSFIGRGIFYVFVGCVTVGGKWYNIVPGTLIGVVGIAYIVLEFMPQIEPPANMR